MKKNSLHLFIIFLIISGCRSGNIKDYITFVNIDPLEKVFRETAFFTPDEQPAETGTGEYATFQFALRTPVPLTKVKIKVINPHNGRIKLPVERTGIVRYVRVSRMTPDPAKDHLSSVSGFYPDPIAEMTVFNLEPEDTQPVWITVKVPSGTPQGEYAGTVKLNAKFSGKRIRLERTIKVKVYPVDLSSQSLYVTNWFTSDNLDKCNNNVKVIPYSKRYWELIGMMAKTMADYRQNVALIDPLKLVKCTSSSNGWSFNFDNFNKMAQILVDEGSMKRLEGAHLARRESNWTSPFYMYYPLSEGTTIALPPDDKRIKDFYSAFIPELKRDLQSNGWDKIYMQHIADEPIEENVEGYRQIAGYIKSLWPDVKIIDACHSNKITGKIDVWVPEMDFLDRDLDFYKQCQDSSEEVWFYTCLAPQGEYANRFIDLPLIKTRLLHWVNFRYGITGYLHWGYNHWNDDPWNETTGIITESGNVLPGGDSWIVYPAYNSLCPSVRLEAMRDGLADYELIKKYSQKYPEKASEIARQVVYNFRRYDTDIASFREKRHEMLYELSN